MQSAKETMGNVAASAKAGMDKSKATAQEKVDRMKAQDNMEKDMATQRKDEKISQAEFDKQQARQHNAAAKQGGVGLGTGHTHTTDTYGTTGTGGHGTH